MKSCYLFRLSITANLILEESVCHWHFQLHFRWLLLRTRGGMTLEGEDLAAKSKVEGIESPVFKKFGNAMELMKKLKGKGAWFGVCPPCADYYAANDKVDFEEKAGGLADEEHPGRLGCLAVRMDERCERGGGSDASPLFLSKLRWKASVIHCSDRRYSYH
jgi:hypothetical protein